MCFWQKTKKNLNLPRVSTLLTLFHPLLRSLILGFSSLALFVVISKMKDISDEMNLAWCERENTVPCL